MVFIPSDYKTTKKDEQSPIRRERWTHITKDSNSKLGNQSSKRFQHMSNIFNDIPMFYRTITSNVKCIPCLVAKTKQSSIDKVHPSSTIPHTEFHFELSGPIKTNLGGNSYAIHFIQPTSSTTDVRLIKARS